MNIQDKALELAKDLSARSIIKIKVGAVIFDKHDIISWGWNNPGNGYGDHAEHMALRRWLSTRLAGGRSGGRCLYIAVYSSRKGRPITSRPCAKCEKVLRRYGIKGSVYYKKEELEGHFVSYRVEETYV